MDAFNVVCGVITIFSLFFSLWIYKDNKAFDDKANNEVLNSADKSSMMPINKFFNSLQSREYNQAWDALTDNFKRTWKHNIDHFQDGYENTESILNLVIFPLSTENPTTHEYGVYFRTVTNGYLIPDVATLRFQTLKSSGEIFQTIENLRKRFVNLGVSEDKVNSLTIKSLMKENASDLIRYELEMSPERMESEFNERFKIESNELVRVFVIKKDDNNWKIDSIQNLTRNS